MNLPRRLVFACLLALAPTLAIRAQDTQPADSSATWFNEKADLPLKAERMLEYTASEGSWISLDVSPDGKQLVFDLMGDLFLISVEGGKADSLTSGMAFDSQPRFSPDGSQVLFVSDRSGNDNLWVIDVATRKARALTKSKTDTYHSPDWSSDGDYVAFSKGEGRFGVSKLWMMHVDGGSGAKLFKEPATLRTSGAAFSPDGRYIWYTTASGTWTYNAQLPQYQISQYDRETGKSYGRTSRYGSAMRPTPSPDGKWLVYASRFEAETGLVLRNLESGDERWLAYPVQRDDQESVASRDVMPGMAFAPDSRSVFATYDGGIWRIPVEGGEPGRIPFEVEMAVGIGAEVSFDYPIEDTPTFTVREIRDAVPSPDGSRLAFTALDRLYVMEYPDGEPKRLTRDAVTEAFPAWSPDGRWIAYATWSGEEGQLMRVASDGSGRSQRLSVQPGLYQSPAWSPDGTRIIAVRGPVRAYRESTGPQAAGAADDLIWIPSNGGEQAVIAPAQGRSAPHFSAESDRIYLFAGSRGLVSIRWDGTDEKEHIKISGNTRPGYSQPNRASWIKLSPTGGRALAFVNDDIYVVIVPLIGGETPAISVSKPEAAAFPARKLTKIGGQFPAWSADGLFAHWSLGNAHFVYDLAEGERVDELIKEEKKAKEAAKKAAGKNDDENGDSGEGDDDSDDEDGDSGEGDDDSDDEDGDSGEGDDDSGDDEGGDDEKAETKPYRAPEHRVLIQAGRDMPSGVVALRGARLITMNGDEVLASGDLVITKNRITAVGPAGEVAIPDGAHVIDLSGATIVPGFVDTHAHMWPAWNLHKPQDWQYLINLAYGVTTTRDPQTSSSDVITYGDQVTAGMMVGPRVYSTGPGIFGDYIEDPIRDLDHARDIMKMYSEYLDTKTIKMYMSGNRQQRQWVLIAAKEQGIMPTTEGGLDLKYNLTMAIDGYPGQEHSFPVYPLYSDVVRLAAFTGIAYTPTLLVSYGGPFGENWWFTRENPHDSEKLRRFTPHAALDGLTRRRGEGWFRDEEYIFSRHAEVANEILEAGGRVGVGSHGQLQGLGYHWELWSVASGGMSNHNALRAGTILGAESIGLEGDLGSIETGKLADLVILNQNPLEDIRNTNTIRYVMMNGRLFDGETMEAVWPAGTSPVLPPNIDPTSDTRMR